MLHKNDWPAVPRNQFGGAICRKTFWWYIQFFFSGYRMFPSLLQWGGNCEGKPYLAAVSAAVIQPEPEHFVADRDITIKSSHFHFQAESIKIIQAEGCCVADFNFLDLTFMSWISIITYFFAGHQENTTTLGCQNFDFYLVKLFSAVHCIQICWQSS